MQNTNISMTANFQSYVSSKLEKLQQQRLVGSADEGPYLSFIWVQSFSHGRRDKGPEYLIGVMDKSSLTKHPRAQLIVTEAGNSVVLALSPQSLGRPLVTIDLNNNGEVIEM